MGEVVRRIGLSFARIYVRFVDRDSAIRLIEEWAKLIMLNLS